MYYIIIQEGVNRKGNQEKFKVQMKSPNLWYQDMSKAP